MRIQRYIPTWFGFLHSHMTKYIFVVICILLSIIPSLLLVVLISYAVHQIQKPLGFLSWQEMFGGAIGTLLQRRLFGTAYQSGVSAEAQSLYFPIILLVMSVVVSVLRIVQEYLMEWIGESAANELRIKIVDSFFHRSLEAMEKHPASFYSALLGEEIKEIRLALTRLFGGFIQDSLLAVIFLVWLIFLHFQLFYVFLAIVIPAALLIRITSRIIKKRTKLGLERQTEILESMFERLKGWETIRSLNTVEQEIKTFEKINLQANQEWKRASRARALGGPLVELLGAVFAGFILLISLRRLADYSVSSHVLTDIMVTIGLLSNHVQAALQSFQNSRKGKASLRRVQSYLSESMKKSEPAVYLSDLRLAKDRTLFKRLEVSQLKLGPAESGKPLPLSEIQFQLNAGDVLWVKGPSGIGKSTLIKTLFGLYKPTSGSISWEFEKDSVWAFEELCRNSSYLSQEPFIIQGTIYDNVVYPLTGDSSDEKQKEKVFKAIEKACLLREPQESILTLSGGEKQRLMFARGFFSESPFWILDEATSALDEATESKIMENLVGFQKGVTVLMIAHRRTLARFATQILELKST